MNTIAIKHFLFAFSVGCGFAAATTACSDWNNHYDEAAIATTSLEVYQGDIVSYLKANSDLSQISAIFEQTGAYQSTDASKQYTFVVADNSTMSGATIADPTLFANNCISDAAVTPSELVDGFGINNRAGKTIWVYGQGSSLKIDNFGIKKTVKTDNGFVYVIDGVLPVRLSVYEYLKSLGDDYSQFKALVAKYEQRVFDREHSAAKGVNQAGEVVYDTVWVTRNTLMDRYTDGGVEQWNMRDENYVTTMFVPNNQQVETALRSALDSIPSWLNREATEADREKFEEWIVRACFSDKRLETEQVDAQAEDFTTVGGYKMVVDERADETTYKAADETWWRPSVQTVDTQNRVNLSNGYAYMCTNLKIPNHIVIYRVKTRFYQIWNAANIRNDEEMADRYFTWENLGLIATSISTLASYDALYKYGWPIIDYNLLSACPTDQAIDDSLTVAVEYSGLVYDEAEDLALPVNLPAGEYYLRMGFDRTTSYTINIFFNGNFVWEGRADVMNADRIANDIPTYGIMAPGYPEGFDPDDWREYDANVAAYDTDGYTVGIVSMKRNGNFRIRVESKDMAYRSTIRSTAAGDSSNKFQMLMYHWCLRPTHNNY
jgi:hypothetical protein